MKMQVGGDPSSSPQGVQPPLPLDELPVYVHYLFHLAAHPRDTHEAEAPLVHELHAHVVGVLQNAQGVLLERQVYPVEGVLSVELVGERVVVQQRVGQGGLHGPRGAGYEHLAPHGETSPEYVVKLSNIGVYALDG